jgi:hypothetical protein
MEYAAYLLLLVAIPCVSLGLFRDRLLVGYLASCVAGVAILAARMIYLEAHSTDSDFDITFPIGVAFWCGALCLYYLIWAAGFYLVRKKNEK